MLPPSEKRLPGNTCPLNDPIPEEFDRMKPNQLLDLRTVHVWPAEKRWDLSIHRSSYNVFKIFLKNQGKATERFEGLVGLEKDVDLPNNIELDLIGREMIAA
ncbi:hypothetical protein HPP92_001470 [Vanilla planifolia]|uniref:Uncharacterized protein n=1 Tax=Vanilla planifolia TaxID=51239 RepID=A0A835VDK7_VANPL|nr:hypothetical protein HPP92_001470 [Vanilla planifolia]